VEKETACTVGRRRGRAAAPAELSVPPDGRKVTTRVEKKGTDYDGKGRRGKKRIRAQPRQGRTALVRSGTQMKTHSKDGQGKKSNAGNPEKPKGKQSLIFGGGGQRKRNRGQGDQRQKHLQQTNRFDRLPERDWEKNSRTADTESDGLRKHAAAH